MTKYYTKPNSNNTIKILKDGEIICKTDKKYAEKLTNILNNQLETIERLEFTIEDNNRIRRDYYEKNPIYSLSGNWENLTIKSIRENNMCMTPIRVRDTLNRLYYENQELYMFRLLYNALLFNEWHMTGEDIEVYKSRRHHDGNLCFCGDYFIVVAILPNGEQVSNHYHVRYWKLFDIPEFNVVPDAFDGHTSKDVISRLRGLL